MIQLKVAAPPGRRPLGMNGICIKILGKEIILTLLKITNSMYNLHVQLYLISLLTYQNNLYRTSKNDQYNYYLALGV